MGKTRKPEKKSSRKVRALKKRRVIVYCKGGCKKFTFSTTEKGTKRTCTSCGNSITDVAKALFTPSHLTGNNHMTKMAGVKV